MWPSHRKSDEAAFRDLILIAALIMLSFAP